MKYLLLGGYGETGTAFIKKLLLEHNEIDVVDIKDLKNKSVRFLSCDLTDHESIVELVNNKYDYIINLIGSFTNDFQEDHHANFIISKNLIDALIASNVKSRLLLVGSAAEYGNNLVKSTTENKQLKPVSVYGLTKSFQTYYFRYINELGKRNILLARTFNVMSRNQSANLLIGNLYRQIDAYKRNMLSMITLGHLENYRDYLSIDDVVDAYLFILKFGAPSEEYNVCSGELIRVYDLVEKILVSENVPISKLLYSNVSNKDDHKYAGGDNLKIRNLGWKRKNKLI